MNPERQSLDLGKEIDPDLAADIEKQGAYVSPFVRRVVVQGQTVTYDVASTTEVESTRAKMSRYLELMVSRFRKLPRKVILEHARRDDGPLATNVYKTLAERGWVVELGHGQVALRGPALNLVRALDSECDALGVGEFGAERAMYPALIPTSTLARCGYFESFPQNVSMVTHLAPDLDAIEAFRQANAGVSAFTIPPDRALEKPEAALSPALCYHAYRSLEGATLRDGPEVVTTSGRCFRYESFNLEGLDRLWDFTMREIVFVGTEQEVSTRRERGFALFERQLDRWDLDGRIETANDPFFSATYASKAYWQVRSDLKFEVRLTVEPSATGNARTIACGSLNLHEDFFGKTFSITSSGGTPAFTGCLAWGLERWVIACFTQHGFDPERWPDAVRREVFR